MLDPFNDDALIPDFDDEEHALARMIRLARRTGDTLIVTDTDGDRPVAIVPIDRYEELVGDLDEVEEDWDFDEEFYLANDEPVLQTSPPEPLPVVETIPTPPVSEAPIVANGAFQDDTIPEMHDASPETVSTKSVEAPIHTQSVDDQAGEEQFYLEPID